MFVCCALHCRRDPFTEMFWEQVSVCVSDSRIDSALGADVVQWTVMADNIVESCGIKQVNTHIL